MNEIYLGINEDKAAWKEVHGKIIISTNSSDMTILSRELKFVY